MKLTVRWTLHAERMLDERKIEKEWVERAIAQPEKEMPDTGDRSLTGYYRRVPEREGRTLRVVCRIEADAVVVITAFFDRRAGR